MATAVTTDPAQHSAGEAIGPFATESQYKNPIVQFAAIGPFATESHYKNSIMQFAHARMTYARICIEHVPSAWATEREFLFCTDSR